NAFAIQLASGKPVERKVNVEFLPLRAAPAHELPAGPLSADDAKLLRAELSFGAAVAEAQAVTPAASGEPAGLLPPAPNGEAAPACAARRAAGRKGRFAAPGERQAGAAAARPWPTRRRYRSGRSAADVQVAADCAAAPAALHPPASSLSRRPRANRSQDHGR